jgi:nicotinate-nucleotide adenylyltransferase
MLKIAIFGGTFDPIHRGHLLMAETAFDQFRLDRIIWVPTFRPSYKAHPLLAFEHRLEMVRRAIANHPAFTVSAIDGQQSGASYAIATLKSLQALEPKAQWYWLIGNDAFQSLPKWQASQALMAQCIWLVAPRVAEGEERGERGEGRGVNVDFSASEAGVNNVRESQSECTQGSKPSLLPSLPHLPFSHLLRWHPLHMPPVEISSSLIRQRCREGRSIHSLVPEAVHSYIVEQNLYQMS